MAASLSKQTVHNRGAHTLEKNLKKLLQTYKLLPRISGNRAGTRPADSHLPGSKQLASLFVGRQCQFRAALWTSNKFICEGISQ
jgi:hypothetical protein